MVPFNSIKSFFDPSVQFGLQFETSDAAAESPAGNLPAVMETDGLCAVAPTLLQRIDKHMLDTRLGSLESMTLRGINSAITFFMRGEICLSALHADGALTAETRTQLAQMVDDLSRTYSQPEITNVDH